MAEQLYRFFQLKIFPATALHISSGVWLDPTDYVIRDGKLYLLNLISLIRHIKRLDPNILNQATELPHNKIAAFIHGKFDPAVRECWIQCHPASREMEEKYQEFLVNPVSQNLISSFISNPLTGNPYIPGSSIKGAIRTALVFHALNKNKAAIEKNDRGVYTDRDMEPRLFEYYSNDKRRPVLTDDPFKYFKVSDVEFPMELLSLRKAENKKKSKLDEGQRKHGGGEIDYYCQVLPSGAPSLTCKLHIDRRWLQKYPLETIKTACHEFFLEKHKQESYFYMPERSGLHQKLSQLARSLEENQFYLRLGRSTGSLHKSVNKQEPETRYLIGNAPMGICRMTLEELP